MVWYKTNGGIACPAIFPVAGLTPRPVNTFARLIAWDVINAATGWTWLA